MMVQSIPELTNYEYNELFYNSAGTLITGSYIYQICDLISSCGIDIKPTDTYDDVVEAAVSQFQQTVGINNTGILNTATFQTMIVYADKMSDTIEGEEESVSETVEALSESPHYSSFFTEDKYKTHRRNHKDIKIVFGNKSISKTIKDVFMRSVTVEVDTSGNPISEVYEFIARDIVESDEISDVNKYTSVESSAPSDIEYIYKIPGTQGNPSHGGGGLKREDSNSSHGGSGSKRDESSTNDGNNTSHGGSGSRR